MDTKSFDIVIRWDRLKDNMKVNIGGKHESEVFYEGGFKWTAGVEQLGLNDSYVTLQCDVDHKGPWKCEARTEVVAFNTLRDELTYHWSGYKTFCFNENNKKWSERTDQWWSTLSRTYIIIEYRINIISSEFLPIIDVTKFASPNELSNVTLVIGAHKLKVSRDYLAILSPVFSAMFFGEFAEKGQDEVEIKDVIYEEFIDLLLVIYLQTREITDKIVSHVLKLADRFQIEYVVDLCTKHLMQSTGIEAVKKLLLADQYRLVKLRDQCLDSFTLVTDFVGKLQSLPEYANFSDETKIAICDRIMKLKLQ